MTMASDEDILFCHSVKSYPCIYDKRNKFYTDPAAKEVAWRKISQDVNIPQTKCATKYRYLRDKFARELRSENTCSGVEGGKRYVSKWPLYGYLKFLEPFVMSRKSTENYSPSFLNSNTSPNSEYEPYNNPPLIEMNESSAFNEVSPAVLEDSLSNNLPPSKRQKPFFDGYVKNQNNEESLDRESIGTCWQNPEEAKLQDEDTLYCLSLVQSFRRFDSRKKRLAKIKIEQILFELEFNDNL